MSAWYQPVLNVASSLWRLIRTFPHLSALTTLTAVLVTLVMQLVDYHEQFDDAPRNGNELIERAGWVAPSQPILWLNYVLPYFGVWLMAGGVVFHIAILRAIPNARRIRKPVWIASFFLMTYAVLLDVSTHLKYIEVSITGEPTSLIHYVLKLVMIMVACLTPALAVTYYSRAKLLDQYTLRTFLQPLLFCFIAFSSLWILMDLLDSLKDFQEAEIPTGKIFLFYLNLIPFIYVSIAPAAILLSVLYTLTKMSRANEIVSMLTAGRSVRQVLRPIFVTALFASILAVAANYYWAPRAEGNRQAIMRALTKGKTGTVMAERLMFHNEETGRTWYAGTFPFDLKHEKLRNVEVRQQDENGVNVRTWIARSAMWWPNSDLWRFYYGKEIHYVDGKKEAEIDFSGVDGGPFRLDVAGMQETPWSIVSSALVPDYMGVPDLRSYLKAHETAKEEKLAPFRTQLAHRYAFPWQSLVLALVAAPLGLSFSRRGVLGGVAGSIFIFFAMMFVNDLFLNLGKGAHMAPTLAVWMPNLIFGGFGLLLLYFRSNNKDLPSLSPKNWFKRAAVVRRPQNRSAAAAAEA